MNVSLVIALFMLLYFHRFVMLLLSAPLTWMFQTYLKQHPAGFCHGRNFFGKAVNYMGHRYGDYSDRLGLYYVGQMHSHHLRMFFTDIYIVWILVLGSLSTSVLRFAIPQAFISVVVVLLVMIRFLMEEQIFIYEKM